MIINFWEAQRRAKARTWIYITLFVLLTFGVAYVSEYAMRVFAYPDYDPEYPMIGLFFLCVTFFVALFQYAMFSSQGGSYVAETVGAELVSSKTTSPKLQQLLNIVEEISIAASVPTPKVYLIDADEINAFAAGLSTEDAVVAVTNGCLERLNRDELQGVIAHEFGHIKNGDMLISMRLAAMVMGFFFVLYIALRLIRFAQFQRLQRDGRRDGNPEMIAALILIVAGAFTWFMGSILKACVSREREYLADASSVQFTRNPDGLANALRKIAKENISDMPSSGIAFSHMYLEDTAFLSSLFATHPPIQKRIAAIEGRIYIPEEWNIPTKDKP